MEQFNAYRMIARIECATRMIMERYNLTIRQANADLQNLIIALSVHPIVKDTDRAVLQQMAVALVGYVKQTELLNYTQDQINKQDALGEREAIYIFENYPKNYGEKILALTDFSEECSEPDKPKMSFGRIVRIVLFSAIVCLTIGICIYHLPVFAEQRAFEQLQNNFDSGNLKANAIKAFLEKYPNSPHKENVMIFDVEILPYNTSNEMETRILAIRRYLHRFPNGSKAAEYADFVNNVWRTGIANYKAEAGDNPTIGQAFIIDMLEYMRSNRLVKVFVVVHPTLNLKDFEDYPESVRQRLRDESSLLFRDHAPRVLSIKQEVTESDITRWALSNVRQIFSSVESAFKVRTIDFVEVKPEELPADCENPVFHLYYTVSNQTDSSGYPVLWCKYEKSQYPNTNECKYVCFGISMSFKAEFTFPGSERNFTLSSSGTAGSATYNNISSPYGYMCDRCEAGFTKKINNAFGLPSR